MDNESSQCSISRTTEKNSCPPSQHADGPSKKMSPLNGGSLHSHTKGTVRRLSKQNADVGADVSVDICANASATDLVPEQSVSAPPHRQVAEASFAVAATEAVKMPTATFEPPAATQIEWQRQKAKVAQKRVSPGVMGTKLTPPKSIPQKQTMPGSSSDTDIMGLLNKYRFQRGSKGRGKRSQDTTSKRISSESVPAPADNSACLMSTLAAGNTTKSRGECIVANPASPVRVEAVSSVAPKGVGRISEFDSPGTLPSSPNLTSRVSTTGSSAKEKLLKFIHRPAPKPSTDSLPTSVSSSGSAECLLAGGVTNTRDRNFERCVSRGSYHPTPVVSKEPAMACNQVAKRKLFGAATSVDELGLEDADWMFDLSLAEKKQRTDNR